MHDCEYAGARLVRAAPLGRDGSPTRLTRTYPTPVRIPLTVFSLVPVEPLSYSQRAKDHLWMHFTRMGGYADADVPVIVRGDGCYLEDENGKRYLDALAGLFSVNIGYGYGEEIGQAALEQMRELPFYTNWTYAHPRAIELAGEVASLAPGDLNRVFFVSGGSEAVESAFKLARQYYLVRGEKRLRAVAAQARRGITTRSRPTLRTPPRRYKAITRQTAYHGTTMGALSLTGIPPIRAPFEPLLAEVRNVRNTGRYRRPEGETEEEFTAVLLEELRWTIESMGPETVCLVHMEPVQNSGGAFTPPTGYFQGVRALCDEYDILLSADEVITAFGRLGHWFGSERYDIRPDLVTTAKGLSSSYAAIGAVIATDRVMEPFLEASSMYSARDHLRRAPGDVRHRAEEHRDHEARGDRRARAASWRDRSGRSWRSSSTCRSSAICAAPASSGRSSSSRTRRRS